MSSESDIRLFLSTEKYDPISALIRWRTACAWSHAGFIRKSDLWTFSAMAIGGIKWRRPNPRAKLLLLRAPKMDEAFKLALTQHGKQYDFKDVLGMLTGRNWWTPGHFICDKLVFWAFYRVGAPLLNPGFIPLDHLTPRDILLSPYVKEDQ